MSTQLSLDGIAFPEQVRLVEPQSFAIDSIVPTIALAPTTADEVASVLKEASGQQLAVIAVGGGSHLAYGSAPARYDVALDIRGLNRVIEHVPADLTVTVEAGKRLDELQARLAEQGQWLRFDPVVHPEATIGGLLATNASGPGRIAYGTLRDLLIGIRFVTGSGEIVHSGRRVVKNVAGYDLGKLMIGSLGTLGVIVEATFKAAPLPATRRYFGIDAGVEDGTLASLLNLTRSMQRQSLAADGVVLRRHETHTWRLSVRLTGSAAAVERSQHELMSLANGNSLVELDEGNWEGSLREAHDDEVVLRCGVLPSRIHELLEAVPESEMAVSAYPTAGVAYLHSRAMSVERIRALRQAAEHLGGSLVIERAPPDVKAHLGVWGTTRTDLGLMQRIKSELDSQGTLSPGRFVGGI